MLTGDQRRTAEALASELGLLAGTGRVLDAREIEGLGDSALADHVLQAGRSVG
jgi:magnesium-transporting ATPase (P-type)